ncbi:hypothetical protein BC829DRAFT_237250 [Chytridium lagenaria]|nr:hypothetical protein BC829DRAFT_237250 [Chytridium lagenaria]
MISLKRFTRKLSTCGPEGRMLSPLERPTVRIHPSPVLMLSHPCSAPEAWAFIQRACVGAGFRTLSIDTRVLIKTVGSEVAALDKALENSIREAAAIMEGTPILVGHGLGCIAVLRYLESYPSKAGILLSPWTKPVRKELIPALNARLQSRYANTAILDADRTTLLADHYHSHLPLVESADASGFPLLTVAHRHDPFCQPGLETFAQRYGGDVWVEGDETGELPLGTSDKALNSHLCLRENWVSAVVTKWLTEI